MTEPLFNKPIWQMFWCRLTHQRHWKRFGDFKIYTVLWRANYRCTKCGAEHSVLQHMRPLT